MGFEDICAQLQSKSSAGASSSIRPRSLVTDRSIAAPPRPLVASVQHVPPVVMIAGQRQPLPAISSGPTGFIESAAQKGLSALPVEKGPRALKTINAMLELQPQQQSPSVTQSYILIGQQNINTLSNDNIDSPAVMALRKQLDIEIKERKQLESKVCRLLFRSY